MSMRPMLHYNIIYVHKTYVTLWHVWFYLFQNRRGMLIHSPLAPKVLLEKNCELTGITLAYKKF